MRTLGTIVIGVLLLITGIALSEAVAADACWQFDNFHTDFIKADVKLLLLDLDPKRVVTAFWRFIVCPGCGFDGHANRIYLTGTFQPDLDAGTRVMTLTGSVQDDSLNAPFVYQCFLHVKFPNATLHPGDASGGCPLYGNFGVFAHEPLSKVPCNTVPAR